MSADLERPRKRQRVTQACQRCRTRKFRCDGESPSCAACLSAQAACSYDTTSGRQRGLRPGYVKLLESLWGIVFQRISGSEHVATQLLAGLPVHTDSAVDGTGSDEASPHGIWRNSSIPAAIRTLLDGGVLPVPGDASVEGTTWTQPVPPVTEDVEQYEFDGGPAPTSPICVPLAAVPPALESSYLPDLPSDWQVLVQVYLCTEYCYLPLFEKSCLYRWAYRYDSHTRTNLSGLESSLRGQYASLWAVLVLGESHIKGARSARVGQMKQAAKTLLVTADSLGPDHTYSPAFLLWALIYTGCCKFTAARMMLAQATVLANLRKESGSAADDSREALVRVGCFVVETVLGFATGAHQNFVTVDADLLNLSDVGEWDPFISVLNDGQETTALRTPAQLPPSRTGSTFQALVRLMTILRKVNQLHINSGALAAELESWEASLPPGLRGSVTNRPTAAQVTVPSQLNLQSWYVAIRCAVEGVRQGVASVMNLNDLRDQSLFRVVEVLETTERLFGLQMLSVVSSVFLAQASQPTSRSELGSARSAQTQLINRFSAYWGWPVVHQGVRTGLDINHFQLLTNNLPMSAEANATSTLELQRPEHNQIPHAVDAGLGASSEITANSNDTMSHLPSQQGHANHLLASVDDPITFEEVGSLLEPANSHDLLDYLTIFEGNNWYVQKQHSHRVVCKVHSLIERTVMTEITWSLSAFSRIWTTLYSRAARLCLR
jgi:hypothetical protein